MPFNFKKSNKSFTVKELLEEATNIYRTKEYIVKQKISINSCMAGNTVMVSEDVYYLRNHARDSVYEKVFISLRKNINGKRIKTALHTRQYVE